MNHCHILLERKCIREDTRVDGTVKKLMPYTVYYFQAIYSILLQAILFSTLTITLASSRIDFLSKRICIWFRWLTSILLIGHFWLEWLRKVKEPAHWSEQPIESSEQTKSRARWRSHVLSSGKIRNSSKPPTTCSNVSKSTSKLHMNTLSYSPVRWERFLAKTLFCKFSHPARPHIVDISAPDAENALPT